MKEGDNMSKKGSNTYKKSIHQQAYETLQGMCAFGESRRKAKNNGTAIEKIYSFSTYKTYKKHFWLFLDWLKQTHPDVHTLKKAKQYTTEWLQNVIDNGASAYTVATYRAAINKIYHIRPGDPLFFNVPKRSRKDIKRSRFPVEQDNHFSQSANNEIIKFGRGTGLRKNKELATLYGGDVISYSDLTKILNNLNSKPTLTNNEIKYKNLINNALIFDNVKDFVIVRKGKGGKPRFAPIIGPNAEAIASRIRSTPNNVHVWEKIPSGLDEHHCRAEYCAAIYKLFARDINDIPFDAINKGTGRKFQSDVYICRNDLRGKKYDRRAMKFCSLALGHNRISVVAGHYLYEI